MPKKYFAGTPPASHYGRMQLQIRTLLNRLISVFKEAKKQIDEAQLLMVASSLAYITILSIIPLLAVSFAIFQAFGGLDKLYATIEPFLLSNLAEGADEAAMVQIRSFINNAHGGAIGVGGFVGLLFTSMSMLSSVETAINRVWRAPLNRSLFQRISAYWLFITLGPLALAVAVGVATSSDYPITKLLPSGAGLLLLTIGVFFAIYKWVPHCKVNTRFALISATVTAVVFNLAQLSFRLYTSKVLTYSKIYGSLGAVPLILFWIYIVWIVVLGGAALTAALQKRFNVRSETAPSVNKSS